MARPSRIEIAGAVYHVSAHAPTPGGAAPAFVDESDHAAVQALLAQTCLRFDAQVLAYCLLPDQYQLLIFTARANLSRLMRHFNGVYTQHHHRRHGSTGALFGARFKAVLVDKDRYLLDACRYIELSPVRLGLVNKPEAWGLSSYPAHAGLSEAPAWLDTEGLHAHVLGQLVRTVAQRRNAADRYARLVAAEPDLDLWPGRLREQIFLGDSAFVARMRAATRARPARTRPWAEWLRTSASREQALYRAHTDGGWSMTALAAELGLSVSRVSRLIAMAERGVAT